MLREIRYNNCIIVEIMESKEQIIDMQKGDTKLQDMVTMNAEQLYDLIVQGNTKSDEVMLFVLNVRLRNDLKRMYEVCQRKLLCDFDDYLDDFFLYLRNGDGEGFLLPYEALITIRSKASLMAWIRSTFRNFISNTSASEERNLLAATEAEPTCFASSRISEQDILFFANLIASTLCALQPIPRFILLRWLMTQLDATRSMSDVEIAKALGVTSVSYRVTLHRAKAFMRQQFRLLRQGEDTLFFSKIPDISLPNNSPSLAQSINDHFDNLYPSLMQYYLQQLPLLEQHKAIEDLRTLSAQHSGHDMHDSSRLQYSIPLCSFTRRLCRGIGVAYSS